MVELVELGNKLTDGPGWALPYDENNVYKVHLPDAGRFLKMSAYCGGYGSDVYARGNIYSDKDGKPYHLLRSTEDVLLPVLAPSYPPPPGPIIPVLVDFPFASPYPEILPNDIWLSFHEGLGHGIWICALDNGNGMVQSTSKSEDFADGSDEYWGDSTPIDSLAWSVYATYELLPKIYATIRDSITLDSTLINPPNAGGYWIQGFWVRKVRARLDRYLADDHNIPMAVMQRIRDNMKERL